MARAKLAHVNVWFRLGMAAALLTPGCGASDSEPEITQPVGWDAEIRVPDAVDVNPDPRVTEVDLNARIEPLELVPGTTTPVWTYNGMLPGPLIRARVGDRVVAHFTNDLPEQTTIHWHGLRIPADMDGMPEHSQPAIEPGGGFEYDFVVPDASTFWYHPHVRSAAQAGNGLYAPFIVEDPREPDFGDELVLVLSDISVLDDGSLAPPDAAGDLGTLFGREGDVLLVNGKRNPTLRARPGLPQRWRIINAARARYFQLVLDGHAFDRIGGDGGLLEAPEPLQNPVIIPGERSDLVVTPQGADGSELVVYWQAYDRGWGTTFNRANEPLFTIRLEGEPAAVRPLPALRRSIEALPVDGATSVDIQLTAQNSSDTMPFSMGINGVPFPEAEPLHAHVGETQIWTVTNTIDFAHPFHLHGFFFQVLDPSRPLEWKDTVDVRVGQTVKFVVRYDERPGMWMFHCHLLDHADAGMMGTLMLMEH